MTVTWGDLARAELRERGLIFFDDVLAEVRAIDRAEVRAAIAVAAADRLGQERLRRDAALDRLCTEAIEAMWNILSNGEHRPAPEARSWRERLRAFEREEGIDRDEIARPSMP
jgi:hypothetical protein